MARSLMQVARLSTLFMLMHISVNLLEANCRHMTTNWRDYLYANVVEEDKLVYYKDTTVVSYS